MSNTNRTRKRLRHTPDTHVVRESTPPRFVPDSFPEGIPHDVYAKVYNDVCCSIQRICDYIVNWFEENGQNFILVERDIFLLATNFYKKRGENLAGLDDILEKILEAMIEHATQNGISAP